MSTIYDYRWIVKKALMEKLYRKQLVHWNERLLRLSRQNACCHGRTTTSQIQYAVWYRGREWKPQHLDWTETHENPYCLELFLDPKLNDEMAVIAEELGEIEAERDKVERFLSGLFLFNAPPEIFHKVLGDTLYDPCEKEIKKFCSQHPEDVWDRNGDFSMNIFVEANLDVIQLMKQRMLVNLVTLQE
jgi:hypothetical protein